jgi:hypothetical protein
MSRARTEPSAIGAAVCAPVGTAICATIGPTIGTAVSTAICTTIGPTIGTAVSSAILDARNSRGAAVRRTFQILDTLAGTLWGLAHVILPIRCIAFPEFLMPDTVLAETCPRDDAVDILSHPGFTPRLRGRQPHSTDTDL